MNSNKANSDIDRSGNTSSTEDSSSNLFHSSQWLEVLNLGFGVSSFPLSSNPSGATDELTISVFSAGPLRIGYLGFPQANLADYAAIETQINYSNANSFPKKIHALRFSTATELQDLSGASVDSVSLPETTIRALQNWRAEDYSKLRRITNRARKSSLTIADAKTSAHADNIYDLYANTIQRHSGALRYTRRYFRALVKLSIRHEGVRCLLALHDNHVSGFHIVACHKGVACYLHGGMNHEFKQYYPSDLLFLTAIEWARSIGMTQYNMLTSPADQPALVKYKEKWGGTTTPLYTHTLNLSPKTMRVFNHLLVPAHRLYSRSKLLLQPKL